MLIIVTVGLLAGIITFLRLARCCRNEYNQSAWETDAPIAAMFTLFISAGFTGIMCYGISQDCVKIGEKHETRLHSLVNLTNSDNLSGTFYLISGSFGSSEYYKYYYKTADGGKQYAKISAEDVVVYEDANNDAYIASVTVTKTCPGDKTGWLYCLAAEEHEKIGTAIHVPRGSIKNAGKFEMDLKQ